MIKASEFDSVAFLKAGREAVSAEGVLHNNEVTRLGKHLVRHLGRHFAWAVFLRPDPVAFGSSGEWPKLVADLEAVSKRLDTLTRRSIQQSGP